MLKRLKNFAGFIENINGLWLFIRIGVWIALVSIMQEMGEREAGQFRELLAG